MARHFIPEPLAALPWRVLLALMLLVAFAAAVLYSAAGGAMYPYAAPHVMRFVLFLLMAVAISYAPPELVRWAAYPLYGALIVLLVLVEALGHISGGSQRWLNLGPLVLQPSELMKPTIVLVLASFYNTLPAGMVSNWRSLVPPALLIGVPMALVLLQPDLGTALAVAFVGAIVMYLAGLPVKWFLGAGAAGVIAAPLTYFFVLHDYQRQRVTTFINPESDPLGTGYHITQSQIAIGSGGILGKGFGNGSQSHLAYLPEAHTDFVFATMAEEWGLVGGLFVLLVFGVVLRWGWSVARRSPDRFSCLLAGGMTATIFFYVAINMMMVMGLAPVVGIPLPFLSYGGSSMMTNMICVGTLMMVERWSRKLRSPGLS